MNKFKINSLDKLPVRFETPKRNKVFELTTYCPECNEPMVTTGDTQTCSNPACSAKEQGFNGGNK